MLVWMIVQKLGRAISAVVKARERKGLLSQKRRKNRLAKPKKEKKQASKEEEDKDYDDASREARVETVRITDIKFATVSSEGGNVHFKEGTVTLKLYKKSWWPRSHPTTYYIVVKGENDQTDNEVQFSYDADNVRTSISPPMDGYAALVIDKSAQPAVREMRNGELFYSEPARPAIKTVIILGQDEREKVRGFFHKGVLDEYDEDQQILQHYLDGRN